MRLFSILVGIIAVLVATGNGQSISEQAKQEIASFDSFTDIKANVRHLRAADNVRKGERRLVNVDLAIKDAIHKVRKETKWPAQFAAWKAMNKTPQELIKKWGMKFPFSSHPKWEKLLAYKKVYGKGPLTYPKLQN
ncbi:hypothetical protein P3T76_001556 [Phytophthora citrophthora]|uniref:RxLR effector protein n=1 Tax=Phytophthora citrophthora TaxID=4793 RepID=A0AAD9GZK9_9STRA|nr:hypothetical protein P3T76_001556 [Phytophthora citrophthora]